MRCCCANCFPLVGRKQLVEQRHLTAISVVLVLIRKIRVVSIFRCVSVRRSSCDVRDFLQYFFWHVIHWDDIERMQSFILSTCICNVCYLTLYLHYKEMYAFVRKRSKKALLDERIRVYLHINTGRALSCSPINANRNNILGAGLAFDVCLVHLIRVNTAVGRRLLQPRQICSRNKWYKSQFVHSYSTYTKSVRIHMFGGNKVCKL